MFTREHKNFLLQCCKRRRFGDGAKFLARPLRVSLYRLRKRASEVAVEPQAVETVAGGGLDADVHGVFAPLRRQGEQVFGDARLVTEVDAQLRGVFRLAGGSYRQLQAVGSLTVSLQGLTDQEDIHCWHRLYWAVRYARAAAAGHRQALGALPAQMNAWFDGQRRSGTEAQASYTVAERICSIAEVLFWTAGGLTEEFTLRCKEQVRRDARLLARKLEYHLGVHNHLLNDARGLYAASVLLPESGESAEWRKTAFGLWEHFFPLLLLQDGTLAEQSSHYHLLLCRTALEYVLAARQAGRTLPEGLETRLSGMFQLANDLLRRDGTLPRFGDNSPDHIVEELWGLLATARFHGLLREPPRHDKATMLTRYYGAEASNDQQAPGAVARLYVNGGFGFLRSASGDTELALHGSPRPDAGAHGDSGMGSFELWRQGRVIIREPGCYLGPARSRAAWFRSAEAQNVTSVDELGPAILLEDQRRLPEWYWRGEGAWHCPDSRTMVFESNCYSRLRCGMKVARRWSLDERGELHFEELLSGQGQIRLRSRLFLGDGTWAVEHDAERGQWLLSRQGAPGARLALMLPEGLAPAVEDGRFTPEYGVEHPAQVLVWAGKTTLPCRWSLRSEFSEAANPVRNN